MGAWTWLLPRTGTSAESGQRVRSVQTQWRQQPRVGGVESIKRADAPCLSECTTNTHTSTSRFAQLRTSGAREQTRRLRRGCRQPELSLPQNMQLVAVVQSQRGGSQTWLGRVGRGEWNRNGCWGVVALPRSRVSGSGTFFFRCDVTDCHFWGGSFGGGRGGGFIDGVGRGPGGLGAAPRCKPVGHTTPVLALAVPGQWAGAPAKTPRERCGVQEPKGCWCLASCLPGFQSKTLAAAARGQVLAVLGREDRQHHGCKTDGYCTVALSQKPQKLQKTHLHQTASRMQETATSSDYYSED